MSTIRVAINGFGRIGRNLFKILQQQENTQVVAINDLADMPTMAHLLKYDSVHGIYNVPISMENDCLVVHNQKVFYSSISDVNQLPWKDLQIDIVVEATGKFKTKSQLEKHILAGAKKVILSAPPEA
jgi:glyceraldehyde 3-phosphate dehydrogenase